MTTKLGEATGPQKRPRRVTPTPDQAVERTQEGEEARLDPDAPVARVGDTTRIRQAWDAVLQRTSEEAQRVQAALEQMPAGAVVLLQDDLPLEPMHELEAQLTKLRVQLEQLASTVH